MYIGLGIFLLVLGLILAFGVITVDINFIDDNGLGAILIVCGILAIVLSLYLTPPAWRRGTRGTTVVHERRTGYDEGPVV